MEYIKFWKKLFFTEIFKYEELIFFIKLTFILLSLSDKELVSWCLRVTSNIGGIIMSSSKYVKKCPECGSVNLLWNKEKGEIICRDCGLVLEEKMVVWQHEGEKKLSEEIHSTLNFSNVEPDKCKVWKFFDFENFPLNLFLPLKNFVKNERL